MIGEMFDRVYGDVGTAIAQEKVQTTLIPADGCTIVDFDVDVPGMYKLVDHGIFRAGNMVEIGDLKAVGPEKEDLYPERLSLTDYPDRTYQVVDQVGLAPMETPNAD